MKAYLLPLGAGADHALPTVLTALSCGAARQPASVSILRIPSSAPEALGDRLLEDLQFCHNLLAGGDAFAFFRTEWNSAVWLPRLPGRDALAESEESRLLLQALRGEGVPFSFRTDPEASEWCLSALLESFPEDLSVPVDESLQPFADLIIRIQADLEAGEDVRIMLLCDLAEGYSAGLALGLVRFLRSRFSAFSPLIGLIGQNRAFGPSGEEGAASVKEFLSAVTRRNLVRLSEERDTAGADAFWLLGLPSSLMTGEDSARLLDWAAARILGEVWTASSRPSAGLHTRELPGILTLRSLDQEAKASAAFLRGAFWCLSDLFPSLRSYLDHPALLRSLAPATRGGLFRKLLRESEQTAAVSEGLAVLDRTFRALMLEILSLLSSLPALVREAEPSSVLWQQAVNNCGRTVTLASEYDVRRREAEDSGIDKVQPVHRVSLSDTEEEELIRRLDQMAAELSSAQAERETVFQKGGGYLSRLALEDCLAKCQAAETSAGEKLALMPADSSDERYALGMQERRVRLLKAAVSRCNQDLDQLKSGPALRQPGTLRPSAPFAGEVLDPALAEQCLLLLTSEGEAAEEAARTIRDGLAGLLKGYPLNDAKMLLKNLLSVCRQPDPDTPLRSLMASVFSVCGVEVSGLRLQSSGQLPGIPLLPDMTEEGRFFSLSSAADRILAPAKEDRSMVERGLLALLILRQYRRRGLNESALEILPLTPDDSILARVFLSSRNVEKACLCSLRSEIGGQVRRLPLAVLLPGLGLEPARLQASAMDLVPSFVFWLNRDTRTFSDPCPFLNEADRLILTEQFTRIRSFLKSPRTHVLADFLSDWHQDIIQAPRETEDASALSRRLRVICGLSRLPYWQKDLQRISVFYESSLPEDPVCAALCGVSALDAASCKITEDVLYSFRGVPIARESAHRLLESTHAPEEAHYLASLDTECDILLHSSDDYHEALTESLQQLLSRFPAADPDAAAAAENLLKEAREPVTERVTELTWPWDTFSSSVLTILTECLGPDLASSALHAFSDLLALFPARGGDILGDVLLSNLCLLQRGNRVPSEASDVTPDNPSPSEAEAEVKPDAVLPPLSPDFAMALCRSPQGQSLIQPGFLHFEQEGASVRVELTLEGAFSLKLIRIYGPEEIQAFYAHDLPTLALWPSLPFAPEDWQAYYSCAHAASDFRFAAVSRDEETWLTGNAPRFAACQQRFPLCYLIYFREKCIGAIPNLLPPPEIPEGDSWTACLDFGSAAVSVVMADSSSRWPLQGPVSVRTLLRSPAATEDLLWREFLPAVPVSPLIPAALRLFGGSVSQENLPLRDGAIFMSSSLQDVLEVPSEALYTDLKWNGEKGRASGIFLHQIMLMTALQARCGGARSLGWKAALPDEMAPEGREHLARIFLSLAGEVSRECGIPLPEKAPPVSFASESTAVGAYFRFCSPDQARGGFMTLDLGAETADLALFLQGREEAVRSVQLPLGLHNILLPALLRRPGILREDFGFVENDAFQQDLASLQTLVERARTDPASLRHVRCGLDAILADHFPVFVDALARRHASGAPGYTGALILLNESFLMMLSGLLLLQISGDSLRNDLLPESMTLFLGGRGSLLMECLSMQSKTSLWKILTMFRNNRVSSLNLLFSAEKKLEIPVGLSVLSGLSSALPHPAAVPAAIAVRPEELIPEFLLRFRREFPEEAAVLLPGIYSQDFYAPFSPLGQQLISQALQAAFDRRETGRPFPALAACLNHLLDMIQEGGAPV